MKSYFILIRDYILPVYTILIYCARCHAIANLEVRRITREFAAAKINVFLAPPKRDNLDMSAVQIYTVLTYRLRYNNLLC